MEGMVKPQIRAIKFSLGGIVWQITFPELAYNSLKGTMEHKTLRFLYWENALRTALQYCKDKANPVKETRGRLW